MLSAYAAALSFEAHPGSCIVGIGKDSARRPPLLTLGVQGLLESGGLWHNVEYHLARHPLARHPTWRDTPLGETPHLASHFVYSHHSKFITTRVNFSTSKCSQIEATATSYSSLSDRITMRKESSKRWVICTLEGALPFLAALTCSRFHEHCIASFCKHFECFLSS